MPWQHVLRRFMDIEQQAVEQTALYAVDMADTVFTAATVPATPVTIVRPRATPHPAVEAGAVPADVQAVRQSLDGRVPIPPSTTRVKKFVHYLQYVIPSNG